MLDIEQVVAMITYLILFNYVHRAVRCSFLLLFLVLAIVLLVTLGGGII